MEATPVWLNGANKTNTGEKERNIKFGRLLKTSLIAKDILLFLFHNTSLLCFAQLEQIRQRNLYSIGL